MAYGTVKVDNITFTNGGIDQTVTVSGIVQSISGNITATGTIQAATIIGTSTVSGATVTGDSGQYGNLNSISGVFTTQVSGATITGDIGQYATLTGISGVFTTQVSGATVTGNVGSFTTVTGGVATITSGVFALGTNALPSISFSGDPNTGIYSPGADQVAISTNGTGQLFVDSSGRIGVGTSSPSSKLQIGDSTVSSSNVITLGKRVASTQNNLPLIGHTSGDGDDSSLGLCACSSDGSIQFFTGNNSAGFGAGSNDEQMRITSAGRVGIGVATPSVKLEINGTTNNNSSAIFARTDVSRSAIIGGNRDTSNCPFVGTPDNIAFAFITNNNERARIDSSGRLGLGTSTPQELFNVSTTSVSDTTLIRLDSVAGIRQRFFPSSGTSKFNWQIAAQTNVDNGFEITPSSVSGGSTFSTPAVVVKSDGKVGVGTTSATDLLSVGTLGSSTDATITLGSSATSSGQIYFGDGTGASRYRGYVQYEHSNDSLIFGSAALDRVTIDSSGRLLVGTSSAYSEYIANGSGYEGLFSVARNAWEGTAQFSNWTDNAGLDSYGGTSIFISRCKSGTVGAHTGGALASGNPIGRLIFNASDGSNFRTSAWIEAAIDGTPGTADVPGRLVFSTTADGASSPTERMRIDSAGFISLGGDTNTGFSNPSANNLAITTNGSERARIDSSGRLLVGTSSAVTTSYSSGLIQLATPTGGIFVTSRDDSTVAGNTIIGGLSLWSKTTTNHEECASIFAQSDATYADGDKPTRLVFSTCPSGSASPVERMRIDSAGFISLGGDTNTGFSNPSADNLAITTNGSEAARIDSSGRLLVGTTSNSSSAKFVVDGSIGVPYGNIIGSLSTAFTKNQTLLQMNYDSANNRDELRLGPIGNNDSQILFRNTVGGAYGTNMLLNYQGELLVGYTSDNGAYKLQVNSQIFATSATIATSDGRYKENVATLDGCVDLVKALRPVSFDWKAQEPITRVDENGETVVVREAHNFPDGTQVGFIAQEVETVLADKPWLGSVIKQNVRPAITDNDGNELAPEEEFLGIAEGNLVAVLTSALKEAIGEIESLKARVAALESA